MTNCSFLLCPYFSFSQGATHCCCSPSIPSSPSLHGSLAAPAPCFSCILSLRGCCLCLAHHPSNTTAAVFSSMISISSLPPWTLPAFHSASVTPMLCACPFRAPGFWRCLSVHLAPLQGAPADKSVWTGLFPFGASCAQSVVCRAAM